MRKQPMKWVSSVTIEKVVSANTKHSGSYAAREMRRLAEDKLVESEERPWKNGGTLAWYRYNPQFHGPTLAQQSVEWYNSW